MMKIIKRNGSEVDFDLGKIVTAVTKANNAGTKKELNDSQIREVAEYVEFKLSKANRAFSVEEIQDIVENQIMAKGAFETAKRYVKYRYTRSLVRKANTTDNQILSLIECNNEEVKQENSIKTQRSTACSATIWPARFPRTSPRDCCCRPIVWRRMNRASSIVTMPTILHSICTTATW